MDIERVKLSVNKVDAKLVPGEKVHTYKQCGSILFGADMERKKILELAEEFGAYIAGPEAIKRKHGIVVFDDKGYFFCETIHVHV